MARLEVSRRSVSYTHLDVYKRQLFRIAADPVLKRRVLLPQGRLGGMKPLVPIGQPLSLIHI